jgi:hypothetical protein
VWWESEGEALDDDTVYLGVEGSIAILVLEFKRDVRRDLPRRCVNLL